MSQVQELLESVEFRELLQNLVAETVARFVQVNEQRARELALMERVVRVEEELKALREIELARFEAMEKRFEALQREMNARFEAMEKRFEALQREMNARFEAMDKRFEAMDKRFEAMEKRFEALQREMNARFEAMDKRFEAVERRLTFTQWMMGVGFTFIAFLITLAQFLLR